MSLGAYLTVGSLVILQFAGFSTFCQRSGLEDPCSDKRYQLAEGAYNSKDFNQAKVLAGRLLRCPEPISSKAQRLLDTIRTRERNNTLASEAFAAIRRGRFQSACTLLARIKESDPSYPNLNLLLNQAGGCVIEDIQPKLDEIRRLLDRREAGKAAAEIDALREMHPDSKEFADLQERAARMLKEAEDRRLRQDYQRARQLIGAKRFADAESVLSRLAEESPDYRDVAEQLEHVRREQDRRTGPDNQEGLDDQESSVLPDSSNTRDAKLRAEVRDLMSVGEYRKALDVIKMEGRGQPDLEATASEIRAKVIEEDIALLEALNSFYSGDYQSAEEALSRFLRDKHSRESTSLARFYLGASTASLHFLEGEPGSKYELQAREIFSSIRDEDRDFRPIWDGISPRIRKLYETVR